MLFNPICLRLGQSHTGIIITGRAHAPSAPALPSRQTHFAGPHTTNLCSPSCMQRSAGSPVKNQPHSCMPPEESSIHPAKPQPCTHAQLRKQAPKCSQVHHSQQPRTTWSTYKTVLCTAVAAIQMDTHMDSPGPYREWDVPGRMHAPHMHHL